MTNSLHPYRSHTCGQLRLDHTNQRVRLSGWVHRRRDHGNLIFIDLRDHYGLTQCVVERSSPAFTIVEALKNETVIRIDGSVSERSQQTVNPKMPTGAIEVLIDTVEILSTCLGLPLNVNTDQDYPEETRLTYRFLDLRREKLHRNITLRAEIIASLRRRMIDQGFTEYQTPILTASSPEGARDFLVPSRLHPGHFYALPQAPQQFKQLLMVAGFDRYFQIAPCFRDEDARADRSPGEFYQLDIEMSFVTQEDVFAAVEPVLTGVFEEFCEGRSVTTPPYPKIPYKEAMLTYGTDKPDLRNPLMIYDVTSVFKDSDFSIFSNAIKTGFIVRAIAAPKSAAQPRSFFNKLNEWAQDQGMHGLGYVTLTKEPGGGIKGGGPIAKFLDESRLTQLQSLVGCQDGDSVFFICDKPLVAPKLAGLARTKIAQDLGVIEQDTFRFCWIVDFPMYERDNVTDQLDFSHNPFSMPQGGLEALNTQDPLDILAYQYDIVCNGIELCSGAIRNHLPQVMDRAFEIVGYTKEEVRARFGGLLSAFEYGAPPHGGCAPGVDRIVMLLANEPNLREIIAFPLNQQAQDLLMRAPSVVAIERLQELHLQIIKPKKPS